ncbi:MAG: ADP-glyceromanno-heptose 6-epimerase [Calditrichia bacterium]
MKIVTGGAGFIGSVLVWYLNQQGIEDILIVDSLKTSEKWKNLRGLKFVDYMEKEDFIELVRNKRTHLPEIDVMFHLGACSSTTEKDASYLVRNNYEYTRDLAVYALQNNVRFIYASSAATYGDGEHGYGDDHEQLDHLRPLNMYGHSKHMFDLWALRNNVLDRMVGLKYFNVYGPNEYHKGDMRSLICKAVDQIRETGKLNLFKSYRKEYADGEQKRDFVYVKDAVKMTAFFYLEKPDIGGIYNIGTGRAHSWNELAEAVFAGMDMPANIEYIEMPEHLKQKYQYFTQAELKKIISAGYKEAQTPFRDAVIEYVKEYLLNQHYITDVK